MNQGWFVTGTDTGIGKTVAAAALLLQLRDQGRHAIYMKPVQTGCDVEGATCVAPDLRHCHRLVDLPPVSDEEEDCCPYRLRMPASPHLAAAREGVTIDMEHIIAAHRRLQERYEHVVVEGAGGVLVPLNDSLTNLDLMQQLDLPVVVVCRPGLGTLNHTLLTLQILRKAGLNTAGLVTVDTTDAPWTDIEEDNQATLQRMGRLPLLGRITYHPALADESAGPDILRTCIQGLSV